MRTPRPHVTPVRRLRLVLAALVSLALVPLSAGPATATDDDQVVVFGSATTAFTSNPNPLHGQSFQIIGQVFLVLGPDSAVPFPDQVVKIQRRYQGATRWRTIGEATTNQTLTASDGQEHTGVYRFTVTADRNASYRARYAGGGGIGPSVSDAGESDPATVRVHRRMPIRLARLSSGGLAMAGSVRPMYARKRVHVQRKTCGSCAWKSYTSQVTTRRGTYRVRLSIPRRGSHYFRARASASNGLATSYSQIARITSR